ncbi:hypothetical protein RYX36_032904, partial [Vicia faba]
SSQPHNLHLIWLLRQSSSYSHDISLRTVCIQLLAFGAGYLLAFLQTMILTYAGASSIPHNLHLISLLRQSLLYIHDISLRTVRVQLLAFVVIAFGAGYLIASLQTMILTYAGGVVITTLVTLPNWIFFQQTSS